MQGAVTGRLQETKTTVNKSMSESASAARPRPAFGNALRAAFPPFTNECSDEEGEALEKYYDLREPIS